MMKNIDSKRVLSTVFVSLLIDLLGFTVILPLFPSLLDFYKRNDQGGLYTQMETMLTAFRKFIGVPEHEDVNSVLFGGMVGSLFSLLQFFNSPIFGAASDTYGRRSMILLSLCGSTVAYMIWAISDSFLLFIIARVVAGLSEANVSISTAVIADLPTAKDRSRGMALIGVAFSIGFVFGPLIGASFARSVENTSEFYMTPALFSIVITIFDIVFVACCLPETLPASKRASSIAASIQEFCFLLNPASLFQFKAIQSVQNTKKEKSLKQLGAIYFLYLFLFSGLEFTLTFLAHRRFSFTRMDQGKMFALLGFIMALVQGGYIRRKMEGKEKQLAIRGMTCLIPGFAIVGLSTSSWMLYVGLTLFAFAAASVVPCLSSLTASHGLESEKGRVMGILRSLGALARATGPICASASYWLIGSRVTYVVGGILLVLPLLLLHRLQVHKSVTTQKAD
uniref:Major facilitator superfamily domain-containing protein 10-like n=1 Tax=Phallusia mammillata TaxID=59560 RepID=A0A6F9DKS0_9ASCI|nr:major facilitator superfamily domain-containing protein 10-like [Phallusia mammillata]